METGLISLLMVAAGAFAFCGGLFDWDFFMNSRKAQGLIAIVGRPGARIFYILLGVFLAVIGVGAFFATR